MEEEARDLKQNSTLLQVCFKTTGSFNLYSIKQANIVVIAESDT